MYEFAGQGADVGYARNMLLGTTREQMDAFSITNRLVV